MWRGFDHLGMYFHLRSFIIDQSMHKKKKKNDCTFFIISFSIGHMYGHTNLLHYVYVLERVRMRTFFFRFYLGIYFG